MDIVSRGDSKKDAGRHEVYYYTTTIFDPSRLHFGRYFLSILHYVIKNLCFSASNAKGRPAEIIEQEGLNLLVLDSLMNNKLRDKPVCSGLSERVLTELIMTERSQRCTGPILGN